MTSRTERRYPKPAPLAEMKALYASGLKLWKGEHFDGPVPEDAHTDSAGFRWIKR